MFYSSKLWLHCLWNHSCIDLCERRKGEFEFSPVLGVPGDGVCLKVDCLDSHGWSQLVYVWPVLQFIVVELERGSRENDGK